MSGGGGMAKSEPAVKRKLQLTEFAGHEIAAQVCKRQRLSKLIFAKLEKKLAAGLGQARQVDAELVAFEKKDAMGALAANPGQLGAAPIELQRQVWQSGPAGQQLLKAEVHEAVVDLVEAMRRDPEYRVSGSSRRRTGTRTWTWIMKSTASRLAGLQRHWSLDRGDPIIILFARTCCARSGATPASIMWSGGSCGSYAQRRSSSQWH